jgi:hypothetical protein
MENTSHAVRTYFAKLGLAPEIADIYLALHTSGPQSMSDLARSSGVERTRIYRLLDTLMDSSLIELESHDRRGIVKAAPIANLNILINKREQELKSLQDELTLIEQVLARNSLSSPTTRVQFYTGHEGIKQMLWNLTKAHTTIHATLIESLQTITNDRFLERWVTACKNGDVQMQSMFGKRYLEYQQKLNANYIDTSFPNWQNRYIDEGVFRITQSTLIYNDVVGYINRKDDETFGVEIQNSGIADSQLQLFKLLWQKADKATT